METIALTGFFGSGKTTLLILLARYFLLEKKTVAILQNEIGKVGVDDLRLGAEGHPVEELLGGCICCSLQNDLVLTIRNIARDHNPDILLLEASGLATPQMLRSILECVDPDSAGLTFLTILDAARLRKIERYLELPFVTNALETADLIVLNKVDCVDPAQMDNLRQEVVKTEDGALLAETTLRGQKELPPLLKMLIAGRKERERNPKGPLPEPHHHHHDHDHHHEHDHGDPVVLSRQQICRPANPLGREMLQSAMSGLSCELKTAGVEMVGHVKVFVEDPSGNYMQANVTDLSGESMVDGVNVLEGALTCTVNAIVYGTEAEVLGGILGGLMKRMEQVPPSGKSDQQNGDATSCTRLPKD